MRSRNDPATSSAHDTSDDDGRRHGRAPVRPPVLDQTIPGDISVPAITLHNLGDLFVPIHNEVIYQDRVAAHGASDRLVQRAIRGVDPFGEHVLPAPFHRPTFERACRKGPIRA